MGPVKDLDKLSKNPHTAKERQRRLNKSGFDRELLNKKLANNSRVSYACKKLKATDAFKAASADEQKTQLVELKAKVMADLLAKGEHHSQIIDNTEWDLLPMEALTVPLPENLRLVNDEQAVEDMVSVDTTKSSGDLTGEVRAILPSIRAGVDAAYAGRVAKFESIHFKYTRIFWQDVHRTLTQKIKALEKIEYEQVSPSIYFSDAEQGLLRNFYAWNKKWSFPGGLEWWNSYPSVKQDVFEQEVDADCAQAAWEMISFKWDPEGGQIPMLANRISESVSDLMLSSIEADSDLEEARSGESDAEDHSYADGMLNDHTADSDEEVASEDEWLGFSDDPASTDCTEDTGHETSEGNMTIEGNADDEGSDYDEYDGVDYDGESADEGFVE